MLGVAHHAEGTHRIAANSQANSRSVRPVLLAAAANQPLPNIRNSAAVSQTAPI